MIKRLSIFILISAISLLFIQSCGTSTGSRYDRSAVKETEKKFEEAKSEKKYLEDFNLDDYRTKIDAPEIKKDSAVAADLEAWYNYRTMPTKNDTNKTVIKTVPGYRVQVISTDNLDEANTIRSEIYFKTNQKAVYVIFDPPFYKVEVGDFIDINDAKNLSFKFKQMGYKDARVVNETINIFE